MKEQEEKYDLPEGWTWTTLEKICYKITDGSHNPPPKQDKGIAMLSARNVENYNINFDKDVRYINEEDYLKEKQRANIEKGDVLLTIVGTIGRVSIVEQTQKFAIQRSIALLKPILISSKYLMYYLSSPFCQKLLTDKATGTAQKGIYLATLKNVLIPLPSLKEQERIVSYLEELLSGLEKSKEQLVTVLDQLNIYKKITLRNAFEGKLTEEKKNDSSTLDEGIVYARQNKKADRRWILKELHEVAKIIMGQSPPGTTYNFDGIGTPLINGPIEFGMTPFSKTLLSKWTTSPTKLCQEGDLIICVRGSTTGRQNIAGFDACIGRGVAALRAINIDQKYLNHYMNYSREKIFGMGTGTTFPNISHEQLSKFPIHIFSLEEQEKIVNEIEYRFTLSDSLFTTVNNSIRHIETFKYSIIQKAFKGNLLEQHDTDDEHEPASILLDRIKVEKEEYLLREKEKKNNASKIKNMPEELKSILEILKENTEPISSKQLWLSCDKKYDIEEFYAELKKYIESGDITELPRNGKESFLKLADKS